ncbi:MAG: hypothetical protein K1X94_03730 [Sandaracinaceae bacterium]|nr:hypothetical protein [Sandaracinaceae bacterium]
MRPLRLVLALGLAVSGCYLSHEREDGATTDAGSHDAHAPSLDAPRLPDAARPCRYEVLAPWQLTHGPGDQGLHDILALESSFLVVTGSMNDPPPEAGRFAHRISTAAELGERELVFGAPVGAYFSNVGLARNDRVLLATTYDDGGCRAQSLDLEGHPLGPARTLAIARCAGTVGTGASFATFDRPGPEAPALHQLDEAASTIVSSSAPIEELRDAFWWSRVRLDDGTFVVAAMHDGVEPTRASVQHLDASGAPLAPPRDLPMFGAASRVRLTTTSRGLLAAWLEQPDGDPTSQERSLRVVPIDVNGQLLGPVQRPSSGIAYRDGGLSSVTAGDRVLYAFIEISAGDRFGERTSLVVAHTTALGERVEETRLDVRAFQRSPVIRVRGDEVVVGTTASGTDDGRTQVFMAAMECR